MSDVIALLSRLSPEERASFLARLRAEKLQAFAASEGGEPPLLRVGNRQGAIPASFWQEQMWYLEQLAPGTPTYNVPFCFLLEGPLDEEALAAALGEIERRHDILRTTLEVQDGQVVQVVAPPADFDLPRTDLSGSSDPEGEALRLAEELARTPLDLKAGPLYRTLLVRLDRTGRKHVLIWVASHAAADGWSVGVLVRELAALYDPPRRDERSLVEVLPIQFADYAVWQRQRLSGAHLEGLLSYWKPRLADCAPLRFPTDYPRPRVQTFRGATHTFTLDRSLSAALLELSQKLSVTPFMTLLAAYELLLARYCCQDDIVVGTAVASRIRPELEPLIGSFVNTIVLRTDLSGDPSFHELVQRVRDVTLDAFAHQDLPFGKLVEELRPARVPGSNPFYQTLFLYGSTPLMEPEVRLAPGLVLRWRGVMAVTAKLDFELAIEQNPDGLAGRFNYSADLFRPETAARLCDEYQGLLRKVVEEPAARLSRVLASSDRKRGQVPATNTTAPDEGRALTSVDARMLPTPDPATAAQGRGIRLPQSRTEAALVSMWAESLGLESIGLDDDFFRLGGHSLLAAQLVVRIRTEFGVDLGLQDFLGACTVAELAEVIERLRRQTVADQAALLPLLERVERMSDAEVAELLVRFGDSPRLPLLSDDCSGAATQPVPGDERASTR